MYAYILRYLALYILILLCYVAMYRSKCYIFSHFHLILSLVPSVAVATTKAWLDLNQCTLSTYLYYIHPNTRQTQQYNAQDMIIITILVIVLARIIIMIIMCALSFSPCVLLLSCTFINLTWLNSFTYKHRYRHHHQNYCDCYTATHTLTGKLRRICTATHEIPLFVLDYTATFFPFSLIKVPPLVIIIPLHHLSPSPTLLLVLLLCGFSLSSSPVPLFLYFTHTHLLINTLHTQ